MDRTIGGIGVPGHVILVLAANLLISAGLLIVGPGDYPNLHVILALQLHV